MICSVAFEELGEPSKLFWCDFDFIIARMEEMASKVKRSNLFVATTSPVLLLRPFYVSLKIFCEKTSTVRLFLQMCFDFIPPLVDVADICAVGL